MSSWTASRLAPRMAALALCLGAGLPAGAHPAVPEGPQFQINTYTTSHQQLIAQHKNHIHFSVNP